MENNDKPKQRGIQKEMELAPETIKPTYKGSGKLEGKVALITGGDSGIGRSVAVHFAREGADVAICYLPEEQEDAEETKGFVEKEGRKCLLFPGDLRDKDYCKNIVEETVQKLGKLNILVNNAGVCVGKETLEETEDEMWETAFDINVFAVLRVTRAALKHMKEGDSIITTSSINAYRGLPHLIDYSATKGAVTAFTRALSTNLVKRKIRVNAVAPGPIWTPLVVKGKDKADDYGTFGDEAPMKRPGQPSELGPSYVFLAAEDSSYITGQCIHPNGGYIINT